MFSVKIVHIRDWPLSTYSSHKSLWIVKSQARHPKVEKINFEIFPWDFSQRLLPERYVCTENFSSVCSIVFEIWYIFFLYTGFACILSIISFLSISYCVPVELLFVSTHLLTILHFFLMKFVSPEWHLCDWNVHIVIFMYFCELGLVGLFLIVRDRL